MSSLLFGKVKFSSWLPTGVYRDTGERSGFVRSDLPAMNGGGLVSREELSLELGQTSGVVSRRMDEADSLADLPQA